MQCGVGGVIGGTAVGAANYILEAAFFKGLHLLERQGIARRLSKITKAQYDGHPLNNFLAVSTRAPVSRPVQKGSVPDHS